MEPYIEEPFSAVVTNEAINMDAIEIRIRRHSGRTWWDLTYHGTKQATGVADSSAEALKIAEAALDAWFSCEIAKLPATEDEL